MSTKNSGSASTTTTTTIARPTVTGERPIVKNGNVATFGPAPVARGDDRAIVEMYEDDYNDVMDTLDAYSEHSVVQTDYINFLRKTIDENAASRRFVSGGASNYRDQCVQIRNGTNEILKLFEMDKKNFGKNK
jgi:hypothetical protein